MKFAGYIEKEEDAEGVQVEFVSLIEWQSREEGMRSRQKLDR